MAFVWELIKETINLPLGCLQGGVRERELLLEEGVVLPKLLLLRVDPVRQSRSLEIICVASP
jgi:hypothetical protein